MNPVDVEEVFLTNLVHIDRAIAYVCRRSRMSPDEAEEFGSHVKCRIIETNYEIIRKFEGRSSFLTYMTTVIQRMFFQYRIQKWGKWRPSAAAKRIGDAAITLERMLSRDGFTFSDAMGVLTAGSHPLFRRAEIEAIHQRLPVRHPRPVLVAINEAVEAQKTVDADDRLAVEARNEAARATAAAVDQVIDGLDAEDQLILRMRFWGARTAPEIAAALNLDSRKVYKRLERLLAQLRTALQRAGIESQDAADLIRHNDHALTFAFPAVEGKPEFRHSQTVKEIGRPARRLRK
jgi:RNA polymerase sigma factor for flagellar operon FliA